MLDDADPDNPVKRNVSAVVAPPEESSPTYLQPDRAIRGSAEDLFDRKTFARRAAAVIARRPDPSSIVVGIYGPWGDGKTSALAMMQEELRADEGVIIINYNPWFFEGSTETLTRGFFATIGTALEKSPIFAREKIGKALARYGKAIPKVGDSLAAFGEDLATEKLATLRDKIGAILRRNRKRVVVFIDDIDRLDRREIQTLFKLVRLSGDFDFTTYVLAFDREMVAEALSDAYGAHPNAGDKFLEKIIQVPLHLPPANRETLRQLAFGACDRVLQKNGIELTQDDASELGNAFAMGFGNALRTPRQVKLFENAIAFAVPILKGEVNPVDQILMEAIRVFYPTVYAYIRDNPSYFLRSRTASRHDGEGGPRGLVEVRRLLELTTVTADQIETIESYLLEKLFPRLARIEYGSESEDEWAAGKRVCSSSYFPRYFAYGVPSGDVSDIAIDNLLAEEELTSAELATKMRTLIASQAVPLLVSKLREREKAVPISAIPRLSGALIELSSELPSSAASFGLDAYDETALLIARLIGRMDVAQRLAALEQLADTANANFAFNVFSWAYRESESEPSKHYLTSEEHEVLVNRVLARWLRDDADPFSETFRGKATNFLFYADRYSTGSVKEELRTKVRCFLAEDLRHLQKALRELTPVATDMSTGERRVDDFRRDGYALLSKFADPEWTYSQLHAAYGKALENSEYPRVFDGPQSDAQIDEKLAKQFAFLHRHATEEARTSTGSKLGNDDSDNSI